MKKLVSVLLATAMTASLVGCANGNKAEESAAKVEATETAATAEKTDGGSELKAELEYWSSWSETENQALALQEAAKQFTKDNPGVEINFTFNGRDNRNLVGSAVAAGTKITMMDANVDNIEAMWSDMVVDLTPFFEKEYSSTNGEKYVDTIMAPMANLSKDLFDGKYSYFPYAPQGFMIFCNKTLLEECGVTEYPETWDEFLSVCEKVKSAGYIPVSSDTYYITSWVGYYLSRLLGNDAVEKLSKDPAAWSDPKVLEAAKAIEDMASKGYFDPAIESNTYPNAQQAMVINGQIAMYINGTWLPNEVSVTTPEDFKWGAFAFPAVENGVDDQASGCFSSYGIAINKDSTPEEIEAAAAFGVYVTTVFDQQFSDMANAIPVSNDGIWSENLKEAQTVLNGYTNRYPSQTAITMNSNSKQIISDACLKLMGGSITAEEFVEMASKF